MTLEHSEYQARTVRNGHCRVYSEEIHLLSQSQIFAKTTCGLHHVQTAGFHYLK